MRRGVVCAVDGSQFSGSARGLRRRHGKSALGRRVRRSIFNVKVSPGPFARFLRVGDGFVSCGEIVGDDMLIGISPSAVGGGGADEALAWRPPASSAVVTVHAGLVV